ncbi:MAG: hypothetical protein KBC22_00595 [Candidatus Pacebacteria bacterium]|nr:hypothetical protein [Candidatus Paceibacterota bacterium]
MVHSKISRTALRGKQPEGDERRIFWYVCLWASLVISLAILFVLLMYQPFFQISRISVQGNHVLHTADIGAEVQQVMSQKKLWVIPLDSWVTLPQKKITQHLSETFGRIKSIDLEVKNFDHLVISIDEWQPAFLWCNLEEVDQGKRTCWFMDELGNIFSEAPYFSPGVYPMFVTKQNSLDDILGEEKIDPETLQQVLQIYRQLETKGVHIETIAFGEQADVIFTMVGLAGQTLPRTTLFVTRNMLPEVMVQNLDLLLGHTSFKEKFATHAQSLEYIDLRFDGKLLFKFKDGSTTASE